MPLLFLEVEPMLFGRSHHETAMPTFVDGHRVQQVLEHYVAGQRVMPSGHVVGPRA